MTLRAPSSIYYVYELVHPQTHRQFFVGRTDHLYKRFLQHVEIRDDSEKARTIAEICRFGRTPRYHILEVQVHNLFELNAALADLHHQGLFMAPLPQLLALDETAKTDLLCEAANQVADVIRWQIEHELDEKGSLKKPHNHKSMQ